MSEYHERRALLVSALRSGEYKQGRGRLRETVQNVSSFCCLGVACDIYHKETGHGFWEVGGRSGYKNYDSFFVGGALRPIFGLPIVVQDWFGFQNNDGTYDAPQLKEKHSKFRSLTLMNDFGMSFKEIADKIESNPPGLWKSKTI